MRKIRVFIDNDNLKQDSQIKVEGNDFDYLSKVMRQKIGDKIFIFNGLDGEFESVISSVEKKFLILDVKEKIANLNKASNITLAFSLLKNVKIEFIAQKAVELGVARIQPIITQHTIVDKINVERFKSTIKEALEQCERNDFVEVLEIKKLNKFLDEKNIDDKIIILCDESGKGLKASELFTKIKNNDQEIIVLIGPEGGFSKEEFAKMHLLKNLYSLNLGPRILRADTAVICALTLTQEFLGDFNLKPCFRC